MRACCRRRSPHGRAATISDATPIIAELGRSDRCSGAVKTLDPPTSPPWTLRLAASVDDARNVLTQRIASAIGGPAGGVGAALVTGKRGLIPEPTNDVLRAAGIYHIVSISGLHMVLAAGTFFWLARALLTLAPTLALLWPVKKMAAVTAMVGATGYCVFSGSDVATVRSLDHDAGDVRCRAGRSSGAERS